MSSVGVDLPAAGPTTTSGAEGPLVTTNIPRVFPLTSDDWAPPGEIVTETQAFPLCAWLPTPSELPHLYTLDGQTTHNFTITGTNPSDTDHALSLIFLLYYPPGEARPAGFEFESSSGMNLVINDLQVKPSRVQPDTSCALATYEHKVDPSLINERGEVTGTLRLSTDGFPVNSRLPQILVTAALARYMQVVIGPSQGSTLSPSLGGTLTVNPPTISRSTVQDTSVPSSGANAPSPSSGSGGPKASVIVPAVLVPLLAIAVGVLVFVLWRRRRRSRMAPSAAFRADHPEGMVAVHRDDGAVGYAGGTTSPILAQSPTPAQSSPYFPYDNKRPFTP